MKHGNHCMMLQNNQKSGWIRNCIPLLLFLYVLLPNVYHIHLIFHHYGFLGEEQEYCGIEILYNIPHVIVNGSIALYLAFKLGLREFFKKYNMHIFLFLLGGVLFFLFGQHSYMDYYSD